MTRLQDFSGINARKEIFIELTCKMFEQLGCQPQKSRVRHLTLGLRGTQLTVAVLALRVRCLGALWGLSLGGGQMDAVHSESCAQGGIHDSSSVVLDPGREISRLAAIRCSGLHARRRGHFQGLAYHALRNGSRHTAAVVIEAMRSDQPVRRTGRYVGLTLSEIAPPLRHLENLDHQAPTKSIDPTQTQSESESLFQLSSKVKTQTRRGGASDSGALFSPARPKHTSGSASSIRSSRLHITTSTTPVGAACSSPLSLVNRVSATYD
jgi:hypothetical protein